MKTFYAILGSFSAVLFVVCFWRGFYNSDMFTYAAINAMTIVASIMGHKAS